MKALVLVILLLGLAGSSGQAQFGLFIDDFAAGGDFQLNGDAVVLGSGNASLVRLVPAASIRSGSIQSLRSMSISSFSAYFEFRISSPGGMADTENEPGGDGLVFMIQNLGPQALGNPGHGVGYEGIGSSVAIEFDTFCNPWLNDPNSNHVGLLAGGSVLHSSAGTTATVAARFDNGNRWHVWIDYDAQVLELRCSQSGTRPAQALLTRNIDIPAIVGGNSAWVGISAATYSAWADFDLLRWEVAPRSPVTMLPAEQVVMPGQSFQTSLIGPPNSDFAILVGSQPTRAPTVFGPLGIEPASIFYVMDGFGGALNGNPFLLRTDGTGQAGIVGPTVPASLVGASLWAQAYLYSPSLPSGHALSTNGSPGAESPACKLSIGCVLADPASGLDVLDFGPADLNPTDPSLQTMPDVRAPTPGLVPVLHDHDRPVGWLRIANAANFGVMCRARYAVSSPDDPNVALNSLGTPFMVAANTTGSLGGGTPAITEHWEDAGAGFPDLVALAPGRYQLSCRIEADCSATMTNFVDLGLATTRDFLISDQTPAVLVHGLLGNASSFGDLEDLLETSSPPIPTRRFLYSSQDGTTAGLGGKTAALAAFLQDSGYTEVDLIAHSMGGLLARAYVGAPGSSSATPRRLVLLGCPNFGSEYLLRDPLYLGTLAQGFGLVGPQVARDLLAGSVFVQQLAGAWPSAAAGVHVLNLIGTADGDLSDGIVRVDEAYLPDLPNLNAPRVVNAYVAERHADWTYLPFVDRIAHFDFATGTARPSFKLVQAFLLEPTTEPLVAIAGAVATPFILPQIKGSPAPVAMMEGTLWLPLGGLVPVSSPASMNGLGNLLWNANSRTLVWVGIPVGSSDSLDTDGQNPGAGVEILLGSSDVAGARLRIADPIDLGPGQITVATISAGKFPY
ncbi:MAG: hypothetical protein H6807_10210 [Planctomycetes bacterium]|nr:hypothetical protein [Planctomycetota bacterium]